MMDSTLNYISGNLNYFRDDELRYRDYERLGREYGDVAMLYFGRRYVPYCVWCYA